MDTQEKAHIRERFICYVGEEKFEKFIRALEGNPLLQKNRLKFWQENLWRDFTKTENIGSDLDFWGIRDVFDSDIEKAFPDRRAKWRRVLFPRCPMCKRNRMLPMYILRKGYCIFCHLMARNREKARRRARDATERAELREIFSFSPRFATTSCPLCGGTINPDTLVSGLADVNPYASVRVNTRCPHCHKEVGLSLKRR